MTTATRPACEATIQTIAHAYGWTPVPCRQSVGVVSWTDASGTIRHACTRPHHAASLVRRFGVAPEPDDRHSAHSQDASEGPNVADCLTCRAAYGTTESEARAMWGDR
ncbi:MAG: hypothetical protein H0V50_02830 [Thermoleophilaceae bacterium]|nr:hypothetical protein [Thermoleophilaceae bacterium]